MVIPSSIYSVLSFLKRLFKAVSAFICAVPFTALRFFRKWPRVCAGLLAVLVLSGVGFGALQATGSIHAVRVLLHNTAVGFVKDHTVIAKAQILAVNTVSNSSCNSRLAVPTTQECVVSSAQLLSPEALSELIISGSDGITKAALLYLDETAVATANSTSEIQTALNQYVNSVKTQNGLDQVALSIRVSVREEYTTVEHLAATPQVAAFVNESENSLPVEEIYTVEEEREIPFNTVEQKTASLYIGSTKTKVKGVTGTEKVTYRVNVAENGTETKTEVSSTVVKQPVDEVILIGVKKVYSTDKNSNLPMLWPVKRVEGSYVSSYMGDDRNHQGMDIAARAGTPVYAAASGTVSYAGYAKDYGNYIIINHENGLQTLYAHNSALAVSKGDVVVAGESIAAIGKTGYATGNHLHFEVRVNGTRVNPVPYIGSN